MINYTLFILHAIPIVSGLLDLCVRQLSKSEFRAVSPCNLPAVCNLTKTGSRPHYRLPICIAASVAILCIVVFAIIDLWLVILEDTESFCPRAVSPI